MDGLVDFSSMDGLKIAIIILGSVLVLGLARVACEWSYSALVIVVGAVVAVFAGAVRSLLGILSLPEDRLDRSPSTRPSETERLRDEVHQLRKQLEVATSSAAAKVNPLRHRPPFSSSLNTSSSSVPHFSTPISGILRDVPPSSGAGATSKVSHDALDRIPLFDGGRPEDDAVTWIALVEDFGRAEGWSASAHRRASTSRLIGAAADWHLTDGLLFPGWEEWREAFLEMFGRDFTLESWSRLVSSRVREPDETVLSYSIAKRRMCSRCPVPLQDKEVIQRLVTGLNSDALRAAVTVANPSTLPEYFAVIRRLDAVQPNHIWPSPSRNKVTFSVPPPSHAFSSPPPSATVSRSQSTRFSSNSCLNCGLSGHIAQNCPRLRPGNEMAGSSETARNPE
jgi:hypothetical protein